MIRRGAAVGRLAAFRHPALALAARAAVLGALSSLLLSAVHSLWWALDFRGWGGFPLASSIRVAAFLAAAAVAGAATLLSRRGRAAADGGVAAAVAWLVGGVFLYGPTLADPLATWLPRMEWWTTTFRHHGEVGGAVYSGWFIVGGGVMGFLFGLLTRGHAAASRGETLWWVALATLAGVIGWGAVPSGAWIT